MTIPRIDMRQVETAPLPGVRVPTDVPIEAAGGAIPRFNFDKAESALDSVWMREKQKADQISVMSADAKAADLETRVLYDPEKGVLNMRGRQSLDGRQVLEDTWKAGMSDIEKDLHNDTQRLAFQRAALARKDSINGTVSRHIATEIEKYDDEQTESLLKNEANAAVASAIQGTPLASVADRSTMAIARQRAAIADFGSRKGWSKEKINETLDSVTSNTHAQVIQRMIANEDDITAKKYYNEFKDQLVGKDLTEVEKTLEVSSLRGESQRRSDNILVQFKDDKDGALAAVKKIDDPQLRDAVEQRVEHQFTVQDALKRDKDEELYLQATNLIEPRVKRGIPFVASAVIPANIWSQLPVQARTALERRALHADSDYPNNPSVWHDFLDLTPTQLGSLNKLEFESRYWANFDRETRARSELMWATARDAERTGKLDAKQAGDLTFKDLMKRAIEATDPVYAKKSAKDWSQDQLRFFNDFSIEAMRRKEAMEATKGKPMTGTEMQEMMDQLVKQRVFLDRTLHTDPYYLPGEISRDDRSRAYVPFVSIPESARNEITNLAKGQTKSQPSQRKIERLYAARLMNDPVLFRAILKEK